MTEKSEEAARSLGLALLDASALGILREEGLIRTIKGRGSYVA